MILHHRRTRWSVVSARIVPLWEGEAPAEPQETVSVQWSLFVHNRSPRHSCPAVCCPHKAATRRTSAHRSTIPWADHHSTTGSLGIVTELVLGSRSMGFSPCRPPRSSPTNIPLGSARLPPSRSHLSIFRCRCSPTTVARAFLPGRLFPTQTCNAAHVDPSLSHSGG